MSANIGEGKYVISVDNSSAINQLTRFEQQAGKTARNTETSFRSAAASAVSLASGVGSLYFQYDNLEKVQLRIRKSSLEVSRAQEEVNKLTNEGKQNTLDYQQAIERLNIAKERNKILTDDLTQAQVALGFSIAQTALSIPAAVSSIISLTAARSANTAATTASTTANWANTFSLLANPIFAIATAASIAAAVALVATNTWGLRDAIFGTTETVDANTEAMKSYNGELTAYGQTATSATSVTRDLNSEMDRTINNLKKNDISNRLEKLKSEMSQGMVLMGSLTFMYNSLRDAGVEGFVRELQKDLREVRGLGSGFGIGFQDILHERNFTARGMTTAQAMILSKVSASVSNYFRDIVSDARNGLSGLSFTKTLHGNLGFLGGITQNQAGNLVNGGRTSSTSSRSGSSKARSGGFGHKKITANTKDTLAEIGIGQSQVDILTAEGVEIPNYYNFGFSNVPRGGSAGNGIDWARFNAAGQAALDEAYRRRQARENRILDFVNRSGLSRSEVESWLTTEQGTDDLYAVIDYRNRLAGISTGTG